MGAGAEPSLALETWVRSSVYRPESRSVSWLGENGTQWGDGDMSETRSSYRTCQPAWRLGRPQCVGSLAMSGDNFPSL